MGTVIFIPKMGANIEEVKIGKLNFKEGDNVKKGDPIFEIETYKATFVIEADGDGKILALNCREGEDANVLDEVGYIGQKGDKIPQLHRKHSSKAGTSKTAMPSEQAAARGQNEFNYEIKATPSAKKLAREHSIDLSDAFAGSGKIIKEDDVKEYIQNVQKSRRGNVERIAVNNIKKTEIEYLSHSKEYLQSSLTVSVSTRKLLQKVEEYAKEKRIMLSLGEYISYNAARALLKYPLLNSYYENGFICRYKDVNIGYAMNIGTDLFVPVIHNADRLQLDKFSAKIKELLLQLIKKEIHVGDLQDGTFTISDFSSHGILQFEPIVNAWQSAILGIGAEYDSAVHEDGKAAYGKKLNLTVAFDHRVCNGKYVADFLNEMKKKLEE
ncbi:2-oxo acid dehydrogenase subunit E2 [Candidatus Woesearchaeota archaeon]|nr:2-oxo acid dehydrogenase subunit E2 [Candidatus Woesearchaeota archaeon]